MEQEERLTEGFAAQGPRALCSEAATVSGSNPDTEGILIGQQQLLWCLICKQQHIYFRGHARSGSP